LQLFDLAFLLFVGMGAAGCSSRSLFVGVAGFLVWAVFLFVLGWVAWSFGVCGCVGVCCLGWDEAGLYIAGLIFSV
jgi:hypothetical protein